MGEVADDMIDGTCCCLCGQYFVDSGDHLFTHGYPAVCHECWSELTEAERQNYQRAEVGTI